MKKIDCFIPYAGKEQAEKTVQGLQITSLVGNIHLVTTDSTLEPLPVICGQAVPALIRQSDGGIKRGL